MIKKLHILTIRDHYKMMVEPGELWYKSTQVRERFFVAILAADTDAAPENTAYRWLACDCVGMEHYGKPAAYFTSREAAGEWCAEENNLHPPPPQPPEPPTPFPLGTYYMLEARMYEIRQIVKRTKSGVGSQMFFSWEKPYPLAWGWYGGQDHRSTWQEEFIAMYDDREQALAHLRKLVSKH
jgi:hypothetical protein